MRRLRFETGSTGSRVVRSVGALLFALLFLHLPALAHVKWFSDYSFAVRPRSIEEIMSPVFLAILAGCIAGVGVMVFVDDWITKSAWYRHLSMWCCRYEDKSDLIIRIATGAVLLLSWQSGALLVPELYELSPWLSFLQLVLAVLILSNRLTRYAGAGIWLLYLMAWGRYGALHVLDYAYLVGAGYYLIVSGARRKKHRATALPALYSSVGFSLCWVAFEKLVYPGWSLQILRENPQLTLGFEPSFFVTAAALVEFSLGFLLIVCLLQRPIAIAISLLFITTTLVFGKLEFVGHALVHAALLVFIIQGPGSTFRTPITFFSHISQRIVFAILGFILVFAFLLKGYTGAANQRYETASQLPTAEHATGGIALTDSESAPRIDFDILKDDTGGWNLYLKLEHFVFAPEACGQAHVEGQGHAHLYIDNKKAARLYGPWYHIAGLPPGEHELRITLNSNDHRVYMVNGMPISSSRRLNVQ